MKKKDNVVINDFIIKIAQFFFNLILRYLKSLPKTVFLILLFVLIVYLTDLLDIQDVLFKLIAFTLNIKESNFQLNVDDVVLVIFIWSIPISIVIEIINKVIKKN